jgi:hypothetical protein
MYQGMITNPIPEGFFQVGVQRLGCVDAICYSIFPEKTWFYIMPPVTNCASREGICANCDREGYRSRHVSNFRSNMVRNYNNTVEARLAFSSNRSSDWERMHEIAMVLK